VVQVAVGLADQHGMESLTLASIAAELGIRIPSLYNYVTSLAGLRDQVALSGSRQLIEQVRRAAIGKAGDAAILNVAVAYRTFAHAHPGIYGATLSAPTPEEPDRTALAQELIDVMFAIFEPYGFSGDNRLHVIRAFRSVMHGFVDLEATGGFGMDLSRDESFHRLMKMFISGLRDGSLVQTVTTPD